VQYTGAGARTLGCAYIGPDFSVANSRVYGSWPRRKQSALSYGRGSSVTRRRGHFVTRLSAANYAHLHRRELHEVHTDASDKTTRARQRLSRYSDRVNRAHELWEVILINVCMFRDRILAIKYIWVSGAKMHACLIFRFWKHIIINAIN